MTAEEVLARMSEEKDARALPDLVLESAVVPLFVALWMMALAACAPQARGLVASGAVRKPEVG